MHFPCPCCRNLTLPAQPPGTFDICPVCYWEDDRVQHDDPGYAGGANRVSLIEARDNYKNFGACREVDRPHVRPPTADETPR
ncbi:MAG: CPCC family cysteine-rich protein [Phycisphaerales bacterium]